MAKIRELPPLATIMEHRRRQEEDGFEFELTATSIGLGGDVWVAHVRRTTLAEGGGLENIPRHLQNAVTQGLEDIHRANKAAEGTKRSVLDMVRENKTVLKAADPFCVAAFINPKLVLTEAELADNPGAWPVSAIAAEDRIGVFMICANAQSEQAKTLTFFRPEPSDDVQDGAAVRLDAHPSLSVVEHAG
jgi:hypothetical protein